MVPSIVFSMLVSYGVAELSISSTDGEQVSGYLQTLDSESVTITDDNRTIVFPWDDITDFTLKTGASKPKSSPPFTMMLLEGTRLRVTEYAVEKGRVTVRLPRLHPISLPADQLDWICHQPLPPKLQPAWQEILHSREKSDLLVVKTADGSLDYLEGVLGNISTEQIGFLFDEEETLVPSRKAFGLAFYRQQDQLIKAPVAVLTTVSGSTISIRSLKRMGNLFLVTSTSGIQFPLPIIEVADVETQGRNVTYLSDMEPSESSWSPYFASTNKRTYLSQFFQPRRDHSFKGTKLRLAMSTDDIEGQAFDKGLAIHSRTQLVYRLARQYRKFTALAGIDFRMQGRGHVRLLLRGDDKTLVDAQIGGHDNPLAIDVDVSSFNRLTILVDFGNEMDISDHLNLCNAKLTQ